MAQHKQGEPEAAIDAFRAAASLAESTLNATLAVSGAADGASGATSALSHAALSAVADATSATPSAADRSPNSETLADGMDTREGRVRSLNLITSHPQGNVGKLGSLGPSLRQELNPDPWGRGVEQVDVSRLTRFFVQAKLAEGSALRELGRVQEALAAVEAAVEIDPSLDRTYIDGLRAELTTHEGK